MVGEHVFVTHTIHLILPWHHPDRLTFVTRALEQGNAIQYG